MPVKIAIVGPRRAKDFQVLGAVVRFIRDTPSTSIILTNRNTPVGHSAWQAAQQRGLPCVTRGSWTECIKESDRTVIFWSRQDRASETLAVVSMACRALQKPHSILP
jgi:hypothetical protein